MSCPTKTNAFVNNATEMFCITFVVRQGVLDKLKLEFEVVKEF